MTPIQLLQKELSSYEKALFKSSESLHNNEIDIDLHNIHVKNLRPLIIEYKEAINKLK